MITNKVLESLGFYRRLHLSSQWEKPITDSLRLIKRGGKLFVSENYQKDFKTLQGWPRDYLKKLWDVCKRYDLRGLNEIEFRKLITTYENRKTGTNI